MKFGIICSWAEQSIATAKGLGFEGVEFTANHNVDSAKFLEEAPEIKNRLDKHGIPALSIGRWGMKRVDDDGNIIQEALQNDYNIITAANIIGSPVFNCGCNFAKNLTLKDNYDVAINYFTKLIDFAKDKNVKIAIFNCDWENFIHSPEHWDIILPALPEIGIKFDPSHCFYRGNDYLKEMSIYGDRFYHFHIKGALTIGGKRYDDPPAGLDTINWGAVFDILYTKNYNGMASLEPHSQYWTGKKGRWGIDFSINYLKPFFMPEDYSGEMTNAYSL